MGMSLNEMLAEVDRWKQEVGDQIADLSADERHELDRQAVAWLEDQIGVTLPRDPRGAPAQEAG